MILLCVSNNIYLNDMVVPCAIRTRMITCFWCSLVWPDFCRFLPCSGCVFSSFTWTNADANQQSLTAHLVPTSLYVLVYNLYSVCNRVYVYVCVCVFACVFVYNVYYRFANLTADDSNWCRTISGGRSYICIYYFFSGCVY